MPITATSTEPSTARAGLDRTALTAVVVCWLFVVFDGYDLIVYGNVISSLQKDWGISPATAGTLGSLAFLGMMIGAVLAGRLSDAIGRKQAVIGCAVILSVFTALCALATGPVMFGALRLIAGLGLGGLVPTANALAAELIAPKWRAAVATMMMSGVPIGGSVAAMLGIPVIPNWGWQPMFLFALVPLAVLVPIAAKRCPTARSPTRARIRARASVLYWARGSAPSASCSRSPPSSPCSPGTAWAPGYPNSCRAKAPSSAAP